MLLILASGLGLDHLWDPAGRHRHHPRERGQPDDARFHFVREASRPRLPFPIKPDFHLKKDISLHQQRNRQSAKECGLPGRMPWLLSKR